MKVTPFDAPKVFTPNEARCWAIGWNEATITLDRLLEAAKAWAAFQEPDSLLDQQTDTRLRMRAGFARQMLLIRIEDVLDDKEEVRPTTQTD